MKVCIAEKPSVAREIAKVLGANSRKDGYLEGNGYAVTWTFGHFCTLKEPHDYQAHWKKWDMNNLPMIPEKFETKLISNKGVKKQFGIIKKLLKQASLVINCGDAGQEGELIQRWVMQQANYKGKVERLWISSLTNQAIVAGFQQLLPASQFDNLYYAGFSRAIGDWILGMNATRLYTLKYGGFKQLLSIGRVQTPTLAMIVQRQKEIDNFKPEPYWELHTIYREVDFHYEKGRFTKKIDGEQLLAKINGKPFTILSFTKKKGKELPPSLFDLTSLQVHCNKRFSYSADQTLKLAQALYEKKVVTYPRVDTTYLPNDIYPKVPGILKQLTNYQQFTQPLLGKAIRKSSKVFNNNKVTDHHAIIPTGVQRSLSIQEQKVYDAVTQRFIAAFYPDCIVSNNTVIGEVEDLRFKATGKEILEEGWRVLYPKPTNKNQGTANKDDKEKKEKILPNFVKGESGPHEPTLQEKMTQPPKYFTEATLLRGMETAGKKVDDEALRELMKSNGIGRPSTRANIIETLFRRKYIQRVKKQIHATLTGVELIDTIKNELLKSAELTGHWERKLRQIEDGEYSAAQFIKEMNEMVDNLVREVRLDNSSRRIAATTPTKSPRKKTAKAKSLPADTILQGRHCPKCQTGKILKGNSAYGCSRYQEGCAFRLPFKFMDKKISEKQLLRLFQRGSTINLKGFIQNGKKVEGLLRFDKDMKIVFEPKSLKESTFQSKSHAYRQAGKSKSARLSKVGSNLNSNTANNVKPSPPKCPKCQTGNILKGKTAYGCSNWKTGCDFRYAFDDIFKKANGKALTRELVMGIITGEV